MPRSLRHRVGRAARFVLAGLGAALTVQSASSAGLPPVRLSDANTVPSCVTAGRLMVFLRQRNPLAGSRYHRLARLYARHGQQIGVRWDIAFLQMMVETANLTFRRPNGSPGDVAPAHNNFAGLGALGDGRPGETFRSIEHGVRAHLEHVLHYAGVTLADPVAERTRKVQNWRILANWHLGFDRPITYSDLALRWAPHTRAYMATIELLAQRFQDRFCDSREVLMRTGVRTPMIAATAWRFEQADGPRGTPGTSPPSGTADFSKGRITALGAYPPPRLNHAAAPRSAAAAIIAPPRPAERPAAAAGHPSPSALAPPHLAPPDRTMLDAKPMHSGQMKVASLHPSRPQNRPAAPPQLSKNDRLRQMVSDRKILLNTSVGATIPIVYQRTGQMHGEAGGLGFFLGASRDSGRWWIAKGKLCQKWRVWLDAETQCMTLEKRGDMVAWTSDDGRSGTARIVVND